ncbi:outer membrane usher protein FimD/PapC [Sphingobium sp. B11D3B]|uniref:fimbria/pilus outer membrane usher protein n=1 Tax=Sphingobium sp. B11D3B TaxID=2940575 RepID=UPI002225FD92|nr:fimbria/pilus outer membrane usher protein [Sphingobium sp. B11D3B]MCW2387187.1 outer membrane usher protein FimD/PapC [Sphingobium sp. B11D3B]
MDLDMENVPEPEIAASDSEESYLYEITINGEPQGSGIAVQVGDAYYIERAMAQAANLDCTRSVTRFSRVLCAVPARRISQEGRNLALIVPVAAFRRTALTGESEPAIIPELTPVDLGFFNYDVSSSLISSELSFTGSLRGGLRLEENAFDLGAVISHTTAPSTNFFPGYSGELLTWGSGDTRLLITDAAYRRNWFDKRLSLAIGRTSMRQRGYLSGSLFDGVGLARENLDNQGFVRSSLSQQITGYNQSAGVLSYRLGNQVLKQVPLAAGPYSIDPSLFAGLPQGGQIEITGYDGRVTALNLPLTIQRFQPMFKAGTWDGNIEFGRMRTAGGGYVAALNLGGRYGVSNDLTVETATTATPHSIALNASADIRLPYDLGVMGFSGAWQWRRLNPYLSRDQEDSQGWSLGAYYERRVGKLTVGGDYQHYGNGGIIAGGYDGLRGSYANIGLMTLGALVREDAQVYVNGPLFSTGISGTLRLRSTSYVAQPQAMRYAEAQIYGGLGRWGNWGIFGRAGEDSYGRDTLSGNIFWSISLGGRNTASLSYQTDRVDGQSLSPDRYALTVNGSTKSHWNQSNIYSLMVDNLGYGTASYSREFSNLSASINAFRSPDTGVNGNAAARGSVTFVDGRVILGKATNDTMLVVKAPTLPDEDVYLGGFGQPVTSTDGAGYAVIPNPLIYRPNPVRVNDANAPLGLEVPDNAVPGTVHPYRGYLVDVKTRTLVPARIFPILPPDALEAGPYADIEGVNVPIEPDGSFYVEDLAVVKRNILLSWQIGDATRSCAVQIDQVKAAQAAKTEDFVRKMRDLACTPLNASPADSPVRPVPVEQPTPRLPYPLFSSGSSEFPLTAAGSGQQSRPQLAQSQ